MNIKISILCFSLLLLACNHTPFVQGKRYFNDLCGACHMDDGSGLEELIPSLVGSEYLKNHQDLLPCLLRNGIPDTGFLAMPPYKSLTAYEISNIINYINTAWGNEYPIQTIQQIEEDLIDCPN